MFKKIFVVAALISVLVASALDETEAATLCEAIPEGVEPMVVSVTATGSSDKGMNYTQNKLLARRAALANVMQTGCQKAADEGIGFESVFVDVVNETFDDDGIYTIEANLKVW